MPGDKVPGATEEVRLTPEKVRVVLNTIYNRLDFMRQKIDRYHPETGELNLTPRELKALWDAMKEFNPAMHKMDFVLTNTLNKDGKI